MPSPLVPGLDSATPPTAAQAAAAKAAGIGMWCVYLATKPGVKLLRPWTDAEIEVVRVINPRPIAFWSGWDDPAAIKARCAALGLRACLDVEGAIRGDGPWVQPALDAAGGGLYSFATAFPGRHYEFAILADRSQTPPDPKATWAGWHPRPARPCGWQWWGTHDEFGVAVDRLWLDDWFAPKQEVSMPGFMRSADPAHKDAHGTGSVYLLDGNRKHWVPSPPPPLDVLRYVTQLAAVHHIAPDITPVDNAILDQFAEDGPTTFPTNAKGEITLALT